ncbi:MAG: Rieske (2Fe-2S) protein [Polyangiales bacterium]
MSDQSPPPASPARRRLLDAAIAVGAAGAVASVGVPAARFATPPNDGAGNGEGASVRRDALTAAGWQLVSVGAEPVLVLALPDGGFRAVSARCTHLGCAVRVARAAGELECPCHGGRFSADGRVLAGPPPAPLETFDVAEAGEHLHVTRRTT